jgi:hypothetical protein
MGHRLACEDVLRRKEKMMNATMTPGSIRSMLLILRMLVLVILAIGLTFLLLPERGPVSHDAVGVAMMLLGVSVVQVSFLLTHLVGRIDALEAEIASLRREAP